MSKFVYWVNSDVEGGEIHTSTEAAFKRLERRSNVVQVKGPEDATPVGEESTEVKKKAPRKKAAKDAGDESAKDS